MLPRQQKTPWHSQIANLELSQSSNQSHQPCKNENMLQRLLKFCKSTRSHKDMKTKKMQHANSKWKKRIGMEWKNTRKDMPQHATFSCAKKNPNANIMQTFLLATRTYALQCNSSQRFHNWFSSELFLMFSNCFSCFFYWFVTALYLVKEM